MKISVLSSGSRGNSVLVQTSCTKILIDLGVTKSYLEENLKELNVDPNEITGILITHTHVDHIQGLKVFLKKYHPKLYVNKIILSLLKEYIDNLKSEYNVIVSGRALMEIYPKQDYHIFITADLEERVKRKCIQYNGYELEKEVRKNIIKRDKLQKLAGFYKIYPNTITVDVTECKSAKESAEKVYSIFCEEGVKNNGVH